MKPINTLAAMQRPTSGEIVSGISLTVPDQTEPIRNILRKYANGVPLPIAKATYHDGLDNFDFADPTLNPGFDFTDAEQLQNQILIRQQKLKKLEKEAEQLKQKFDFENEVSKRLNDQKEKINKDEKTETHTKKPTPEA